jgi:hypothetical protein
MVAIFRRYRNEGAATANSAKRELIKQPQKASGRRQVKKRSTMAHFCK